MRLTIASLLAVFFYGCDYSYIVLDDVEVNLLTELRDYRNYDRTASVCIKGEVVAIAQEGERSEKNQPKSIPYSHCDKVDIESGGVISKTFLIKLKPFLPNAYQNAQTRIRRKPAITMKIKENPSRGEDDGTIVTYLFEMEITDHDISNDYLKTTVDILGNLKQVAREVQTSVDRVEKVCEENLSFYQNIDFCIERKISKIILQKCKYSFSAEDERACLIAAIQANYLSE